MTRPTNSSQKRRRSRQSPTLFSPRYLLLFFLAIVLAFHHSSHTSFGATAKEIEATHEWTLLGENDTVASGMHVRMDLTTGEKWVKLMDENDDDGTSETVTLGSGLAVVDANGKVTAANNKDDTDAATGSDDVTDKAAFEPNYDYEMMHRTLSKLPPEEIERIGGIPELPATKTAAAAAKTITPEQRAAFEARMKEIWEQRQADLKAFQNDHLADLPQLLKDRIQAIRDYLEDPRSHLQALDLSNFDERDHTVVGDIVAVLFDLEYQLTDVDMARDFYTLGGWPLLTSLLADAVHESGNLTTSSATQKQQLLLSDDDWNKVNLIQAHAAWAIGTTVKNTGEFTPYALAEVEVLHNTGTVKTTPLDLILAQFIASSKAVMDTTSPKDDYYDTVMMKVHKTLYALGALLRGNRQSQTHFCADQGPALLETVLSDLAEEADTQELAALSKDSLKLAQRLLALAQDIVMDVTLHASKSDQVDEAIRNAFSSPQWCATIVRFAHIPRLYETTLQTIQQLAPSCGSRWDLTKIQQQVNEPPVHVQQSWLPEDLDDEIRKDRMELLEATVKAIQEANQ